MFCRPHRPMELMLWWWRPVLLQSRLQAVVQWREECMRLSLSYMQGRLQWPIRLRQQSRHVTGELLPGWHLRSHPKLQLHQGKPEQ